MSNIEQGDRAKIEEIDSTNQSLFKNLLRRVPEKSYVLGRYDRNLTRKFYEREDVVKLKWWKYDGKRTNNIETLKQERKIPNGGVVAVFLAESTAAQIAISIVERGETPTEIEWERKDILVCGDLSSSDLEMNESTRTSYVFDKVQGEVLSAARREINSDKYRDSPLGEIGSDLISIREKKKAHREKWAGEREEMDEAIRRETQKVRLYD